MAPLEPSLRRRGRAAADAAGPRRAARNFPDAGESGRLSDRLVGFGELRVGVERCVGMCVFTPIPFRPTSLGLFKSPIRPL